MACNLILGESLLIMHSRTPKQQSTKVCSGQDSTHALMLCDTRKWATQQANTRVSVGRCPDASHLVYCHSEEEPKRSVNNAT